MFAAIVCLSLQSYKESSQTMPDTACKLHVQLPVHASVLPVSLSPEFLVHTAMPGLPIDGLPAGWLPKHEHP